MSNNNDSQTEETDGIVICTICYERYCVGADLSVCDCGHVFHHHCLMQWLNEKHNCPNCRIERPKHSKVFLDYEANELHRRGARAGGSATNPNDNDNNNNNSNSGGSGDDELTSNVVENLLYETGLLTEEIDYLNQRFVTKDSELTKKDEELHKMHLDMEKQRVRIIKLESVIAEIRSNIPKTDTFEGLVTEIINTISGYDAEHIELDSNGALVSDTDGAAALPDPIIFKPLENYILDVDDEVRTRGIFRCKTCGDCHLTE